MCQSISSRVANAMGKPQSPQEWIASHDELLDIWEHMTFGGVKVQGPTHNFYVVSEYELKSGHRAERHRDCGRIGCFICEGGLFYCTVCGALEGALLPKCPGRMLTYEEHEANYKDYCDGTGPFKDAGR